jgi:sec-independent protein translocase protein TatA
MGALFEKPAFLILILIVLLLFGAKRLPDLARGLGRSARILKSETEGLRTDETPAAPPAPAAQAPAVTAAPAAPAPSAPAPVAPDAPRYLVDPVTGEQILAQPVTPPADGAPRA